MLRKSASPLGTFEEEAFQLSMLHEEGLQLELFEMLGYPRVPLVGTYGEDYAVCLPLVLLEARGADSFSQVPREVLDAATRDARWLLQVSPFVAPAPCQHFTCDSVLEFNVMLHAWRFPGFQALDSHSTLLVGAFEARGLLEVHQNARDVRGSGLPLGRLEERECSLHGNAFSPHNCQVGRDLDVAMLSFWLVAKDTSTNACVVSRHYVCNSVEEEARLRERLRTCDTLEELQSFTKM